MQQRPVVEGKIDHDEPGCRQLFVETCACVGVSRVDQSHAKIVQARIVTNHEQRARVARLADKFDERVSTGVVDAFVFHDPWRLGKGGGDKRPGFLCPRRRRYGDKIGNETVADHVGANDRRVGAPPRYKLAIAIALAGLGAFRLGVAQQQQTTHLLMSLGQAGLV